MRAQIQLQQGEGSDEEGSDEDDEPENAGWGAKKGAYYEQGEVCTDAMFPCLPCFNQPLHLPNIPASKKCFACNITDSTP